MPKAQMKKSSEPVTPMKIINDLWAARVSLALIAAIDLDLFTAIARGKKTVADLAKALDAPKRGVERLIDALAGMGYLTKKGVSAWVDAGFGCFSRQYETHIYRRDGG
jgi:hypothetical protein